MLMIDSQCTSTSMQPCEDKGYNGGKHIKGKKKSIITDTLGLIWDLAVDGANTSEYKGADNALETMPIMWNLKRILFDQGYDGKEWLSGVEALYKCKTHIVQRVGSGFKVQEWRWIVERTFAWLGGYRRLSKDYESKTKYSESYILLAMSRLMLKRLC